MVFGEHWGQRLSLVLARGQADLVLGAVAACYIRGWFGIFRFCLVRQSHRGVITHAVETIPHHVELGNSHVAELRFHVFFGLAIFTK